MKRGRSAESPERVAQAVDDGVQAVLEVDERAVWPEPLTQLLARDEIAGSLQQQREDVEGLSGKAEAHACLAQLTCVKIQLEHAEPDDAKSPTLQIHSPVAPVLSVKRDGRGILARHAGPCDQPR